MIERYKVSVIIPAFNAESTIVRMLDSVINQTYKYLEIMIIDDGSTDNTYNICLEKSVDDVRITVLHQSNQGVSVARNYGISHVTGDFIMFADADDFLPPYSVESLVSEINYSDELLVQGSHIMLKTRNREQLYPMKKARIMGSGYDQRIYEIIRSIPFAPWGKLFSVRVVKDHNIEFPVGIPYGEDGVFLLTYLRYVREIAITDDIVYYYNFTDQYSAANKYYTRFYEYMHLVAQTIINTCLIVSGIDYSKEVHTEYYNRCLKHYIIHERDFQTLVDLLRKSYCVFPYATHEDPQKSIDDDTWRAFVATWKRNNIREYVRERLKLFIYRLCYK